MIQSKIYKRIEFVLIFILVPVSFAISYPIWIKMCIAVFGFAYIIFVLLRVEKNKFKVQPKLPYKRFFNTTLQKLLLIAVFTTIFVYFTEPSNLFIVAKTKPLKWLAFVFLYSLLSVYPQELIYRTFFFQRYQNLFNQKALFYFINAIVFSLAHLFFKNTVVLIITFLGGFLFCYTFGKTKSTLLVSIEHAIYGSWLFTVGMGEMLGFPN